MWRVLDKIKYFLLNLFIALKDTSLEYDMKIKQTKSPTYRLIFWLSIGFLVVALVMILLWFLRSLVNPVQNLNFQSLLSLRGYEVAVAISNGIASLRSQ